jgi:acyl transferase domain-containing protein/phosphopantetheinyl transferase/acyl carrier protein
MSDEVADPSRRSAPDIAVIGMACLFPGAPDLGTYWRNIVGKVSAIGEPPPGWAGSDIFDPESREPDRIYSQRGGFLGDIARFDPTAYGVMPLAVDGAEPEHFLALRVAHEALLDAGYLDRPFDREKAGVILGRGTFLNRGSVTALQHGLVLDQTLGLLKRLHPEYRDEDLREIKRELRASLPPFNAETAPGLVSNVMCGRIANRLDLKGPNYAVDAACASSLVALDSGVRELQSGRCDLMLVGGVSVSTPPIVFMVFCQLNALSRRGQIRPFDVEADGVLLGEGIGMVVLKRREEAERDGDRIYAVIKGVGIASDGRALAVLAPRVEGEELALRRAYEAAGVSPATVELIEAHGTGTPIGDATEINALRRVFGERAGRYASCGLGSVKSMISHTIPAAGVAGLIKVAMALYQKTLPPTLNVETPNPKFELERTPFYINTETRPWIHGGRAPRRAGVNAFGFGGINAHVILEEHAPDDKVAVPSYQGPWDSEVVVLQGADRADLIAQGDRLRCYLAGTPAATLHDIAYTVNTELHEGTERLALIAGSTSELDQKLRYALGRLADPACARIKDVSGIFFFEEPLGRQGTVAFLFPGEGAQYVNMLADLCLHFPEVRACFDRVDRVFLDNGRDYVPSQVVFPPPFPVERDESALWQVDCAIASVFSANRALAALLSDLGVTPAAVAGHSSGEYAALLFGGAVEVSGEEELLQLGLDLNTFHASVEERIPAAVLVTVGAVRPGMIAAVVEHGPGPIHVTMDNCPHQVVLCGTEESAAAAIQTLRSRGAICSVLPFERAYHTPLFESVSRELEPFYRRLRFVPPRMAIYSCATAAPVSADPEEIRKLAVAQWASPVRFRETVEAMHADGVRVFVEVGPRGNLSGFVNDTLRGRPHVSVPMNVAHRSGITQLNHAVGLLAAHGVSLQLGPLYERRRLRRLNLDQPEVDTGLKKPPMRVAVELPIARVAALPRVAGAAPTPTNPATPRAVAAEVPTPAPAALPPPMTGNTTGDASRTRLMAEYLSTMERFLDVQQEVVRAFLGTPSAGPVPVLAPRLETFGVDVGAVARAARPASIVPPARVDPPEQPGPAPAEQDAERGEADPAAIFLRIVSEKTGYPMEMLDLSLNMEADLGIDSIKRIEILGAFQRASGLISPEEMEHVAAFKTLQQVIGHAVEASRQPRGPVVAVAEAPMTTAQLPARVSAGAEPSRGVFVGGILSLTPEEEVVVACTLDLRAHEFLRHHTIGGRPSAVDESRSAMPIVPLTISLEIMAEVAAILCPGQRLTGMRDVRAARWFNLDADRRSVVVAAKWKRSEALVAIEVQILEAAEGGAEGGRPIIEGTMLFGEEYDTPPAAMDLGRRGERAYRYAPADFYREVMFHGPFFQSVVSMDRCGEDGAEATVISGAATGFFNVLPAARFLVDPVLLDAAGQVVGFWTADRLDQSFVVFPIGFESVRFYAPLAGTVRATCRSTSRLLEDGRVRSDIDFIDAQGRLLVRFTGWEDMRFDVRQEVVRFVVSPREHILSEPWPAAVTRVGRPGDLSCCRLRLSCLPKELFNAVSPIWRHVWGRLIFNPEEYEEWARLTSDKRRAEWLIGRLVAKDAVRRLLSARYGLQVCPGDIEIATDPHGKPVLRGPWAEMAVSLTHSGDVVAAVAGEVGPGEGLGLDVEVVRELPEEIQAVSFNVGERALLAREGCDASEWTVRLWCAKEALGKALGRGLPGGPQNVIVRGFDQGTGAVQMVAAGGLASALRLSAGQEFTAYTTRDDDVVVACVHTTGINQSE